MDFDLALAGIIIGTLVGLTGIGGGSLLTPALIIIFKFNPLTAVGTDLVFNAATKLFGSVQHSRQGTIDYRLAFTLAVGSIPASLAGIGLITLLEHVYGVNIEQTILRVLAGTLIVAGGIMILRPLLERPGQRPDEVRIQLPHAARRRTTIALGAVTGFLVGLTSIGSGALIVPVLSLFYPLAMKRLVGTDIFHAMLLASVTATAHWGAGNVDWGLAGNLLIGSVPGVVFGARLAVVAPDRVMRTALGLLVVFSGARLFTV
jgi:uncharacterized membrane protein YfcA